MGLFETYRVAGGEAGMRHFISQFGPALAWPWTKLMDVPEMTDELIDKIASQSDAQSGAYSIRELEAIRDKNLLGFIRLLKQHHWGAGAFLNEVEASRAPAKPTMDDVDVTAPLQLHEGRVQPEWIDYNGHMTEHRYGQVFGEATDALLALAGMDEAYLARGYSYFTVETHIRHLQELSQGDDFTVRTQLLSATGKKLTLCHELHNDEGVVVATSEHLLLHVNSQESKSCEPQAPVAEAMARLHEAQSQLPAPDFCGRAVGMRPASS